MVGVSKIVRSVQLIAAIGLLLSGCSTALDANEVRPDTEQAREHLIDHEVDEAQALYSAALVDNPEHGHAAAGKAITDLLLLAQAADAQPFWVEFLGAESVFDAGSVFYDRGGLFYWMSKGVPWGDDGDYAGIRSLITDRLPWSAPRLESLYAFTRGLDQTLGDNLDSTVAVADALAQIERELRVALEDDEFEAFVLPGEVFHATDVDVVMGPAELAALSSAVSFLRGVIYLNAAYAHDWTPEGAVIEANGDRQAQIDHAAGYLDVQLFRAVEDPARLGDARESFARALRSLRESVDVGERSSAKTALNWRLLSSAERDSAARPAHRRRRGTLRTRADPPHSARDVDGSVVVLRAGTRTAPGRRRTTACLLDGGHGARRRPSGRLCARLEARRRRPPGCLRGRRLRTRLPHRRRQRPRTPGLRQRQT